MQQRIEHEDERDAGPIGTSATDAAERRRTQSVEYRREEAKYAVAREVAGQVILYRGRRNLSQQALADLIGTSGAQISRIESGTHLPSTNTLQRLAEALDLNLSITLSENPTRP